MLANIMVLDFFTTAKARTQWSHTFKLWGTDFYYRIPYSANLEKKCRGEQNYFSIFSLIIFISYIPFLENAKGRRNMLPKNKGVHWEKRHGIPEIDFHRREAKGIHQDGNEKS